MRSTDWSSTPLGPVSGWPGSLQTAVRIMLGSLYPMFIWWGRELVNLYNDGYLPMLGKRHPDALGKPAAEIWREIWDTIGPQTDAVLHERRATWNQERLLVLERNGYPEEAYFTFSYSPIPGDGDEVGGLFCALSEDTQRILGQRRIRTLRELAAGTSGARTPEEVSQAAARCLEDNVRDVPFALIYLLDDAGRTSRLSGRTGAPEGSPWCPDAIDVAAPTAGVWPFARIQSTRRAELVPVAPLAGPLVCSAWPEPVQSAVVVPLLHSGQGRVAGFLVMGVSPRRAFDDEYRGFADLVAVQVAAALANARAYEDERRRAETLAELDRAKTAFFSNITHEFRTPLTLLMAPLAELLERGPIPPVVRTELALVHRNASRLQRLVNTLLDFARIEAGRFDAAFVPTDLVALTRELASTFESTFERAGLAFVIECAPLAEPVYVDRSMWEKIVLNLLSNAFKYTHAGTVTVRLEGREDVAVLTVSDTGSGIPPAELPRVFERFHRVQGTPARSLEGTGIGLALVQELARLHGGEIRVESEPGRGSTFTVCIPRGKDHLPPDRVLALSTGTRHTGAADTFVQEALGWLPLSDAGSAAERFSAPGAAPADDGLPIVVLADDNRDMRDYLTRLLSEQFRVVPVADGEAALAAVRECDVDLVLADVMMPGLDGFAVLAALRRDQRTRALPVILLSARAGEEARIEGLRAGADDYLTKPFTARELVAKIASHVHANRTRRAATRREREIRLVAEAERNRWQEMVRQAPALTAILRGADHVFEMANVAYLDAVGRPGHRIIGQPLREAMPELAGQGYLEQLDDVFRTGTQRSGVESRVLLARGPGGEQEERVFNYVYSPYRDFAGQVEGVLVQAVDVTDQVRARTRAQELAAVLEAQGAWLRKVLDLAPVAIELIEPRDAQVRFANRAATELTDAVPQIVQADLRRRVTVGELVEAVENTWEVDGQRRWLLSHGDILPPMHGQPATGVLVSQETTALKRVEDELRDAHKFQAIGKLAGGIAHEYNNLLTVVIGHASLLLDAGLDEGTTAAVEEIRAAADRAAVLTSQLLAFGRKQLLRLETVSLNDVVRNVLTRFHRVLGSQIAIELTLDEGLDLVRIDTAHLEQVLVNLVLNARDAMPAGGKVSIETAVDRPADTVVLSVSDTGLGMSAEVKARIFEPFFTTKPFGQGTGLGLSVCEGIITQCGGRIEVDSAPGVGSTFRLVLPRAREVESSPAKLVPGRPPKRAASTVLVIEDDVQVLRIAVFALTQDGHSVLAASGPDEALRLLELNAGDIDLVVSDVVLPRMSGPDLVGRVRVHHPAVRAIFISGYAEECLDVSQVSGPDSTFLSKPFSPKLLREKVRQLLRNPRSGGRSRAGTLPPF